MNLFQNVMFPKENFTCAIFILFISYYMIPGAGHLTARVSPPREIANFVKKNAHARG